MEKQIESRKERKQGKITRTKKIYCTKWGWAKKIKEIEVKEIAEERRGWMKKARKICKEGAEKEKKRREGKIERKMNKRDEER